MEALTAGFSVKLTWTMVREAAATIPQTKQLAYRPSSSSSSTDTAIIHPAARFWTGTRVKTAAVRRDNFREETGGAPLTRSDDLVTSSGFNKQQNKEAHRCQISLNGSSCWPHLALKLVLLQLQGQSFLSIVSLMSAKHPEERTVEVLEPPGGVDEELLSLYFENKRRSGGGPLESVEIKQNRVVLVFEEAEGK
ncbi:hypothetical protein GOODEAATRI_015176 [Goodea atripinnis]|uniref:Uncharacterized protein n=1 Tax=Goodea atripinnis TaxID=208336 RepID=A0ABV0PY62_9TELE